MKSIKRCQQGFSFLGFMFVVSVFIFAVIVGLKLAPAYMTNADIKHIFKQITSDPSMKDATTKDIKESFNKRATIDNVSVISSDDLDISTDNGGLTLSANYSVKIPLFANITLLLEFNPSSSS